MGMAYHSGMFGSEKLKVLGSLLTYELFQPIHRLISQIPQV